MLPTAPTTPEPVVPPDLAQTVLKTSTLSIGAAVPIPNLLLVSSQNKLALSCVYVPEAPANTTEPVVNAVDVPVPPLATGNAVPEYVIASVPLVVIGLPDIDSTDGTVAETEVTEPDPLLLNVVQSVELKAPRLVAEAVGTCSVITGVVVEFATVEDKSVPVVPRVKAETEVTVPRVLFAIVIEPVELVTVIPVPAVKVVLVSVFPVVLPINICPLV